MGYQEGDDGLYASMIHRPTPQHAPAAPSPKPREENRSDWMTARGVRAATLLIALLMGMAARGLDMSAPYPDPPQAVFGELFAAVQNARVFADGKEFADAVPSMTPQRILADYREQHPRSREELRLFVAAHFSMPADIKPAAASPDKVSIAAHIDRLWDPVDTHHVYGPRIFVTVAVAETLCGPRREIPRNVLLGFVFHDVGIGTERPPRSGAGYGGQLRLLDRHFRSRPERHAKLLSQPLATPVFFRDGGAALSGRPTGLLCPLSAATAA